MLCGLWSNSVVTVRKTKMSLPLPVGMVASKSGTCQLHHKQIHSEALKSIHERSALVFATVDDLLTSVNTARTLDQHAELMSSWLLTILVLHAAIYASLILAPFAVYNCIMPKIVMQSLRCGQPHAGVLTQLEHDKEKPVSERLLG